MVKKRRRKVQAAEVRAPDQIRIWRKRRPFSSSAKTRRKRNLVQLKIVVLTHRQLMVIRRYVKVENIFQWRSRNFLSVTME